MPRKQKSTRNQQAGKPKPNLGQKEAELERAGKEQMRHMGAKDARKAASPQQTWLQNLAFHSH